MCVLGRTATSETQNGIAFTLQIFEIQAETFEEDVKVISFEQSVKAGD